MIETATVVDAVENAASGQVDMTDEVLANIEKLVDVAKYLKRVAGPIVKKYAKRKGTKAVASSGPRRNGFAVDVTMEPRLVQFLLNMGVECDKSTLLPRNQVTKHITNYIHTNNLQLEGNRKNFQMDDAMASLFNVNAGTVSNWFELQKYMKGVVHSKKASEAAAVTDDNVGAASAVDSASTPSAAAAPRAAVAVAPASAPASADKAGKRVKRAASTSAS